MNPTLSSILIYTMGLYWLHEGTHQRLDAARARFFWQGVGSKRKYHMVKWDTLARPKEFGELGFLDTRAMNTVLLAKRTSHIDGGEDSTCIKILGKKKYLRGIFSKLLIEGVRNFGRGFRKSSVGTSEGVDVR